MKRQTPLEASARQVAQILEGMNDGFFALDPGGCFTYVNEQAERMLGRKRSEMLGRSIEQVFPEEVHGSFGGRLGRVPSTRQTHRFETFYAPLNCWLSVVAHQSADGVIVFFRDVTDRRLAREALRASEARLRTMVENLPAGAVFVHGESITLNRAAEGLLGWSRGEMRTLDDWFLLTLGNPQRAAEERRKFDAGRYLGTHARGQYVLRCKDGSERVVEVAAYSEGVEQVWVLHDLTEVITAQEKFRILFEKTDAAHVLIGNRGITDCNDAAARMLGLTRQQLIGRHPRDVSAPIQPGDVPLDEALAEVNRRLDEYGHTRFEWIHLRSDGAPVAVQVSVTTLYIAGRRFELGSWVDLTHHKEEQRRLLEREATYRGIVENSTEIIYSIDIEGRFLFVSPSWTRYMGHDTAEVVGTKFEDYVHPLDRRRGVVYQQRLLREPGFHGKTQYRVYNKAGELRYHETSASLVRDAEGNPMHFVGVATDVTERHEHARAVANLAVELQKANRELTEARDAALESARAKGQFLATMSHEVRTPLNGVLGMAAVLRKTNLDEQQAECVDTIQASGETLLRVIDDVLDISKIEAGGLQLQNQPIDLVPVLRDTVALFHGRALEKKVDLQFIWEGGPKLWVSADAVRLKQILGNLVSNAVKFTDVGKVLVRGVVRQEGAVARVKVAVADSGVGIPDDRLEAIFESFTQVGGNAERSRGGTGLGLSIARRLVEHMGGTIGVDSREGKGSRFWFEVPLTITTEKREERETSSPVDVSGLEVLVVEDNAVNVLVAQRMLERSGCKVQSVSNGLDAIEYVRTTTPHLVLMDLQMPEMDGYEATRRLRKMGFEGCIVALTATAFHEDRETAASAGMDHFLAKPLREEELIAVLEACLERKLAGLATRASAETSRQS